LRCGQVANIYRVREVETMQMQLLGAGLNGSRSRYGERVLRDDRHRNSTGIVLDGPFTTVDWVLRRNGTSVSTSRRQCGCGKQSIEVFASGPQLPDARVQSLQKDYAGQLYSIG